MKYRRPSRSSTSSVFVIALLASFGSLSSAQARELGFATTEPAQGCGNCHYQPRGPGIEVKFSNSEPALGDEIVIDVSLKAVDANAHRMGLLVDSGEVGKFVLMDATRTKLHAATRVMHSKPAELDDEKGASFKFKWQVPSSPGVAHFVLNAVSSIPTPSDEDKPPADKYNSSSSKVSLAFGCDAIFYYPDVDGDGFGDEKNKILSCEPVEDSITKGGDCNDTSDKGAGIHPDAEEICDSADNDCDGETDEGLDPGLYYKDADGDGFVPKNAGSPTFGCNDKEGFAMKGKVDCDDKDRKINPDAEEICDGKDNNCSGEIDDVEGKSCTGDESAGGCSVGRNSPVGPFPIALALALSGVVLGRLTRRRRR